MQRRLRETMWEDAGLVRDEAGLRRALAVVEELAERLPAVGVPGHRALNTAWQDWLNLDSQLAAARLIVLSALERRESRGAHFRRDFPDASPDAPVSVRVRRQHGTPAVWSEPVRLTRARPPAALRPAAVDVGD
jgi:fumarate reductase flavoprotein subunit